MIPRCGSPTTAATRNAVPTNSAPNLARKLNLIDAPSSAAGDSDSAEHINSVGILGQHCGWEDRRLHGYTKSGPECRTG
jgi:hypothetical protein